MGSTKCFLLAARAKLGFQESVSDVCANPTTYQTNSGQRAPVNFLGP